MSGYLKIPISGLKPGLHIYDFEINKEFFERIEESEVKEGELKVTVEAEKRSSHIDLNIKISGRVRINCDRCLEMFYMPVECENRLLVKFGKTRDESDPDILTIPVDENELELNQYFYEFIYLAIPIKRVHPDDKNGNSTCDQDMLRRLEEHIVIEDENRSDPRWEELKKLMNNN
jgi:uncharacterized metal-binding protein YceD (DUF177 family)